MKKAKFVGVEENYRVMTFSLGVFEKRHQGATDPNEEAPTIDIGMEAFDITEKLNVLYNCMVTVVDEAGQVDGKDILFALYGCEGMLKELKDTARKLYDATASLPALKLIDGVAYTPSIPEEPETAS